MTIAGRNGAGKTTLLRMLAGEESIDRGELSLAKGARIMLHDQRPPRERGRPLREYVLSGCVEELAIEAELAELERRMAEGASGEALLARYSRAQARLEARGGYLWRDRATAMARGLGFREDDLDRGLDTLLRRSAHARLARPRARHLSGRAAARRAHQPPRHRVAGVVGADARRTRRGDRPGRARPLVPGGRRHGRAGAGGRPDVASSPAPGTSGAASRPRGRWRSARRSTSSRPRSSAWSASSSASARRPRRRARRSRA